MHEVYDAQKQTNVPVAETAYMDERWLDQWGCIQTTLDALSIAAATAPLEQRVRELEQELHKYRQAVATALADKSEAKQQIEAERAQWAIELAKDTDQRLAAERRAEEAEYLRDVADARVKQLDGELHTQKRLHESHGKMVNGVWASHEKQFAEQEEKLTAAQARVAELEGTVDRLRKKNVALFHQLPKSENPPGANESC